MVFGCQTPGAMASRFVIPADRLHRVPEGLDDIAAALVEPLATPIHAVARAAHALGQTSLEGARVAVLGAGAIGLFVVIAARAAGARAVLSTDLSASKRRRALRVGANATVDPALESAVQDAAAGSRRTSYSTAGPMTGQWPRRSPWPERVGS